MASILTLAACAPAAPVASPTATSSTSVDYSRLSGNIVIDGSSTVFPITEAAAEEFGKLASGKVRVTVGVSGTGGGFKKFCDGETDIQDASRPIKESEAEACKQKSIEYVEVPVAIDGLTVLVNPQNTFVGCMTVQELKKLWAPEAQGKITRWNQVRPDWPNEPVRLYGPGVDSGTFDYFTEAIVGKAQASRGDFTASEDDNVLVQGISGDKNALGYFGYAYYVENKGKLKALAIDGGNGCVAPTEETINNGVYAPLSRPIFIYVRKEAAGRPEVKEFVRYYLSDQGQKLVSQVGYIPFPAKVYELGLARFEKGALGTIFGGRTPQKGPVQQVLAANQ
ncbi:MAG: PstS family phosphate ABC transporter substrate-binding protein [Chloroflexi bacterium]|nr:PstS family phosphate ABC transporter substrate-binding protein [Chloroflexota bacterium]